MKNWGCGRDTAAYRHIHAVTGDAYSAAQTEPSAHFPIESRHIILCRPLQPYIFIVKEYAITVILAGR